MSSSFPFLRLRSVPSRCRFGSYPATTRPTLAPFFARAVPTRLWTHREFAFTLGESTYVRYNSFNSADDFKKEILRANPTRFEIGPVYNARVSGG